MHIDGDTYDNLEFDTILKSVSLLAVNELARQRILDQRPVFLKKQIETMLREIDELKEIMVIEGGFSLDYYHDIRPILHKIEPFESYLEIEEIQKIQKFIDVGNTVKNQISKLKRG